MEERCRSQVLGSVTERGSFGAVRAAGTRAPGKWQWFAAVLQTEQACNWFQHSCSLLPSLHLREGYVTVTDIKNVHIELWDFLVCGTAGAHRTSSAAALPALGTKLPAWEQSQLLSAQGASTAPAKTPSARGCLTNPICRVCQWQIHKFPCFSFFN